MIYKKRNLYYTLIYSFITLAAITIFVGTFSGNSSPAGKMAGKLNVSNISVCINNQLIPSYDFKRGVYIVAEDLQLFGFVISKNEKNHSINIALPKNSSINKEYIPQLSQLDEEEKVYYPQEAVTVNGTKIASYSTNEYTLIPINILDSLGKCSKQVNSTYIYCDLHN